MIYLDLTPSELLVYALLYSYTLGTEGLFYASLDYISEQTGVARRTVNSAVKKLLSLGYIERAGINGKNGLRTVLSIKERILRMLEGVKEEPSAEMMTEEKIKAEPVKKATVHIPKGRFWLPDKVTGEVYPYEPKYTIIKMGQKNQVKMTPEQYDKLKSLIPDFELLKYVEKLASIHIERSGRKESWAKSDYRIIRDWIDEDFRV